MLLQLSLNARDPDHILDLKAFILILCTREIYYTLVILFVHQFGLIKFLTFPFSKTIDPVNAVVPLDF